MAESEAKFIYATTTVRSKLFAAKFKFLFLTAIFEFPTSESNFQHQKFENQNSQPQNSNFQPQPSFKVFTPDPNYMPYTRQTQITCHKCGYPNHLATNCTVPKTPPSRGAQNPFIQNSKNQLRSTRIKSPNMSRKSSQKSHTYLMNFLTQIHQKCVLFFH